LVCSTASVARKLKATFFQTGPVPWDLRRYQLLLDSPLASDQNLLLARRKVDQAYNFFRVPGNSLALSVSENDSTGLAPHINLHKKSAPELSSTKSSCFLVFHPVVCWLACRSCTKNRPRNLVLLNPVVSWFFIQLFVGLRAAVAQEVGPGGQFYKATSWGGPFFSLGQAFELGLRADWSFGEAGNPHRSWRTHLQRCSLPS